MTKKKTDAESENETRDKAPSRDDESLMKSKVNSAGGIMLRQIKKLESAQRNAIKSGNVPAYNLTIEHLVEKISALKLPENATFETEGKPETFDMDALVSTGNDSNEAE